MLHRPSFFLLPLLLSSTSAFGQGEQAAPPTRCWYLGAESNLELRPFAAGGEQVGAYLLGGTLYGGYALTPSLTLQAGLLHGRGGSLDDNYADDGTPKYVQNAYRHRTWGLPVLLRVRLSQPQRKFQVDALAGISLYRTRLTRTYNKLNTTVSTDGWVPVVTEAAATNGYFSAGLGLRYACSPRWQVVSDVTLNATMQRGVSYYGRGYGAGATLGLQYRLW